MSLIRGGGGGELSESQAILFSKLTYNPITNRVESSVPISTTLNSFYLEDQFKISAGGDGIFYRNISHGTTHWNVTGTFLDQSIAANQGFLGASPAATKIYAPALVTAQLKGAISSTGAITNYAGVTGPLVNNISVWSVRCRLGEDLAAGSLVDYSAYDGSDGSGVRIFHHSLVIENDMAAGDFFQFWSDHPSEAITGDIAYGEIIISEEGEIDRVLQVYALESDPDEHWNELSFRTYSVEYIASELSLNSAIGDVEFRMFTLHGLNTIHSEEREVINYQNEGEILWL